jgi:hypothetical protein
VPPDGGYGWVIMGAAFLCNVVVDGIIFSIGLVVAALADSFEVEISKATWVGSLLSGFYLIAGDWKFGLFQLICLSLTQTVVDRAKAAISPLKAIR